jgi:DNA invertase Pin-like site-specific DNA recombinase
MTTDNSSSPLRSSKVHPWHLDRLAVVYVRQSSPQQVLENHESTERQYALVNRAVELGWPRDRVLVIDDDQGKSAGTSECRLGFQRLLAELSLDHIGLILGIEMSRLARSCKDWHHLLELCSLFRTVLADQDGLYDPNDPNDRLLLGLKGTMSEAELQVLRGRLRQGLLNKVRRGAVFLGPPVGYIRSQQGGFEFDHDEQACAVVGMSLAATQDVIRERASIEKNWQQRIERARIAASRAERQYQAAEPENRLVARTLEKHWEEALQQVRSMEEDYARFQRTQPPVSKRRPQS